MKKLYKIFKRLLMWTLVFSFVIFYPMLISIYVFLPLLVGVMGYMLIKGFEKGKISYIFIGVIYFINLEVNLDLPLFLTIIAALLVYIFVYFKVAFLKRCKVCRPLVTVVAMDFIYLGLLLSYDFMFQTSSIVLNDILQYSLIVDMLMVILL